MKENIFSNNTIQYLSLFSLIVVISLIFVGIALIIREKAEIKYLKNQTKRNEIMFKIAEKLYNALIFPIFLLIIPLILYLIHFSSQDNKKKIDELKHLNRLEEIKIIHKKQCEWAYKQGFDHGKNIARKLFQVELDKYFNYEEPADDSGIHYYFKKPYAYLEANERQNYLNKEKEQFELGFKDGLAEIAKKENKPLFEIHSEALTHLQQIVEKIYRNDY